MIPLTDNNPTRRFPIVCVIIIALNVLVFLYDQFHPVLIETLVRDPYGAARVARDSMGELSFRYSLIPAYVTGMIEPGAPQPLFPLALHPAWLTIFTSMFLHANWLHVGGNMLYVWIFGNNIEDALGKFRFALFYLLCGVGAAMAHILSGPASTIPTVGASGAAAGLMGAYILLYPSARVLSLVPIFGIISTLIEVPAVLVIGYWFLLQVINVQWLGGGEMLQRGGGVAYVAHIGGFAAGALLILLFGGRKLLPPPGPPGFDDPYSDRHPSREE